MKSPDINIDLCVALIRELLSGYRGYPASVAGEQRFAFALQENAVSVSHAREILKSFDEFFPTVRQIADVAANLRARFEIKPDETEELRRKYGPPQAFDKAPADVMACHWQAFRDTLYYVEGPGSYEPHDAKFWREGLERYERDYPDSMAFVRHQIVRMGWKGIRNLSASPEPMPYKRIDLGRRVGSLVPVTQEDIERASAPRKSTQDVDREFDGWDDPDR